MDSQRACGLSGTSYGFFDRLSRPLAMFFPRLGSFPGRGA